MRHRPKVDRNQAEIVAALEGVGCSVTSLAPMGGGIPDLLVGRQGRNYLLEVKVEGETLTPAQGKWGAAWRGQAQVVRTVDEALSAVGVVFGGGGTPRSPS